MKITLTYMTKKFNLERLQVPGTSFQFYELNDCRVLLHIGHDSKGCGKGREGR